MALNKLIARYTDGKMLKGSTQNFDINAAYFHLLPDQAANADNGAAGKTVEVLVGQLKAIFFVADFAGCPTYEELKQFCPESPQGRRVKVVFNDGEVMLGATLNLDSTAHGFFLFPADPRSNNKRVYVINKSVKSIEQV